MFVCRCVGFAGTGSELMRMDYVHSVERLAYYYVLNACVNIDDLSKLYFSVLLYSRTQKILQNIYPCHKNSK